jgi:hypothetical protein
MTWGEFKKKVEDSGLVNNDTQIRYIDTTGAVQADELFVSIDEGGQLDVS